MSEKLGMASSRWREAKGSLCPRRGHGSWQKSEGSEEDEFSWDSLIRRTVLLLMLRFIVQATVYG